MRSTLISRLLRLCAIIAGTMMVGAGVSDHASAQKGNYIQYIERSSSSFFLSNPLNRDAQFTLAAINGALDAGQIDELKFSDTAAMVAFYAEKEGRTLWIDPRGTDHKKAAVILSFLQQSWTHGLNPESYHVARIAGLLNAAEPVEKARLELLVSDAVIRYAHDLTGLRLPVNAIRQDPQFWRKPLPAYESLKDIADAGDLEKALGALAPQDGLYQRLRQELITLAGNPERAKEQATPLSINGILRPGDIHPAVLALRTRLGVAYDPLYGSERKYDDRLAAAVMTFQRQNGVSADGAVGPSTLALLNRSSRDKMDQIIANMERLRWLGTDRPDKYIIVNVPSATLWAVEKGKIALEMPVIVGRPERATKSFVTEISGVRFNPKWTVPPTIKAKDFLPRLVEDPAYLHNKGIEVSQLVDGKRYTLDSTAIDWSRVSRQDLSQLRMVQSAGDDNALGRFRVLMDNPYDIYLHDTNSRSLFSKTDRALSSGCIRMEDPESVARFILEGNKGWSDGRMTRILDTGRTSEVAAQTKIPVYILYQTIWLDDKGALIYGPDIYKQDRQLIDVMVKLKAYDIPALQDLKYAETKPESVVQ